MLNQHPTTFDATWGIFDVDDATADLWESPIAERESLLSVEACILRDCGVDADELERLLEGEPID